MLRVYLFGGLRVYHGEHPLPPFPTHKTRGLLAYVVTFRIWWEPRQDGPPFWCGRAIHTATHQSCCFERREDLVVCRELRRNLVSGGSQ